MSARECKKRYWEKNKDRINAQRRADRIANKEKYDKENERRRYLYKIKRKTILPKQRKRQRESKIYQKYYQRNRELVISKAKLYRENNRDKINQRRRELYQEKKERKLKRYMANLKYERKNKGRQSKWYWENRDKVLEQHRNYLSIDENRLKHNEAVREYRRKRRLKAA